MKVHIGKYPNKEGKERKIEVRIDSYDIWNADHTMALIIHPILVKLKEAKQGVPNVDSADLPDHINNEYPHDPTFNAPVDQLIPRWNWVLDEMIWSFEQSINDNEDQFFGDNTFNKEAYDAYWDRKINGKILFGKYYHALWT